MKGYQKIVDVQVPPDEMLVGLTGPMAEGLAACGWSVVDQSSERA